MNTSKQLCKNKQEGIACVYFVIIKVQKACVGIDLQEVGAAMHACPSSTQLHTAAHLKAHVLVLDLQALLSVGFKQLRDLGAQEGQPHGSLGHSRSHARQLMAQDANLVRALGHGCRQANRLSSGVESGLGAGQEGDSVEGGLDRWFSIGRRRLGVVAHCLARRLRLRAHAVQAAAEEFNVGFLAGKRGAKAGGDVGKGLLSGAGVDLACRRCRGGRSALKG